MRLCVYGAASSSINQEFIDKVEQFGFQLAKKGHSLVFGAGKNGLMGATARGVKKAGGYILGVVPKFFDEQTIEVIYDECDELIQPDTMRERKKIMEDNADAFVVVPGGIGTFEEFFEILTLKQLCRHDKPIVIYNLQGYYNELYAMLETATDKKFLRKDCLELFKICDDLEELFNYLENYKPTNRSIKDMKDG
ncbi:MAG: TIGR00730 family Rossman fold protein [Clostridiales bacterium]|nr:TIGR00730 family Rossman fold protein [Clostridiales bacterium]